MRCIQNPLLLRHAQRRYRWSGTFKDIQDLVIFEDNHVIALFKPAGILSQSDNTSDIDLLTATKG
jgi:23S rRNA-/tRNA-specific pseudouridylate synthase